MERARLVRTPLASRLTPSEALRTLRADARPFALVGAWAGGGAVLGSDPVSLGSGDPFGDLDRLPEVETGVLAEPSDGLPAAPGPTQPGVYGGWFGWLGFGLGRTVETVPPAPPRPVALPGASLAFYDHVVRLDAEGQWWFEALWTDARASVLTARRAVLGDRLSRGAAPQAFSAGAFEPRPSPAGHEQAVRTCLEYIRAGDLYQANLCLRLEAPFTGEALDLFADAVEGVAPRYGAFVGDGDAQICSLSPELFLERRSRAVRTAPIKGTAPRSDVEAASARSLQALADSVKDRAENVMILDLMRNDLGRVSAYGSVAVTAVARPEPHAGVWHLVSEVEGRLRDDVSDAELLHATFPPGSVTGAPKVKALEVISTLESTGREVYTGAIGFASPVAGLELNVAIRTFEVSSGRVWLGAGGGIVADSDPAAEYEECLVKAEPLIRAVGGRLAASTAAAGVGGAAARGSTAVDAPPGTERRRVLPPPTRTPRPDPARGVFTTMAVREGKPLSAIPHIRRLAASVRSLYGIALDELALRRRVVSAARAQLGPGRLRVAVTPGGGIDVTVRPASPSFPEAVVTLAPLVIPGGLGEHKWIDREIVAGPEAVIVDLDGTALEITRGTLWIVEGDRLLTPPSDGRILPGVTRDYVLALEEAGESEIPFARLHAADDIFITSAIRGLQRATLEGRLARPSAITQEAIHHLATTASLAPAGR